MTPPAFVIPVWFQPIRFMPDMVRLGINTFLGPSVENSKGMDPTVFALKSAEWVDAVSVFGGSCILKLPPPGPLPSHCIGLFLSIDEPNGKGIAPGALKAESDDLRARYPGVPIVLSLAGDKVTSANFKKADQVQLYKDYAALADILTVDAYAKNRNATRYPTTWTGDAVKTLIAVTGKEVWAWVECNDQVLPPPTSKTDGVNLDINRAPTPDEIRATVDDAIAKGAKGIGWFITCDSGKYGWPDSFFPQTDRTKVTSMAPQYAAVKEINAKLSPPPVTPTPSPLPDPVAALTARLDAQDRAIGDALAKAARTDATLERLRAALNPPQT